MPNEVHNKTDVAEADVDFDTSFAELDSLGDKDLAWSAPITSLEDCSLAEFGVQLKTGTSPTAGGTVEIYYAKNLANVVPGTDDIDTT